MNNIKRYPILDIWVDDLNFDTALKATLDFLQKGDRLHTIFAANPEKNFSVPKDPVLYKIFKQADLLLPDGIGMVLAGRLLYNAAFERVPGCEFMQALCGVAAGHEQSIFIYGAREDINAGAAKILVEQYPGLRIAGRSNGYIPDNEMGELVEHINESKAKILFLALGSPRQEQWIGAHCDQLEHVRVCQGIGGTLDVITGHVERAPELFCRVGLEWLYRLLREPKRLKRQYVLPLFAWYVVMAKLKRSNKLEGLSR